MKFELQTEGFKITISITPEQQKILSSVKETSGFLEFRNCDNSDLKFLGLMEFSVEGEEIPYDPKREKETWDSGHFSQMTGLQNRR